MPVSTQPIARATERNIRFAEDELRALSLETDYLPKPLSPECVRSQLAEMLE